MRIFFFAIATWFFTLPVLASRPDSVFLFAYATEKNSSHNGLHFAWSMDKTLWHPIGPEFSFVKSDYGRWGSQKRMLSPFLLKGNDNQWHCVWALNEQEGIFAHAASPDLVYWGRQSYHLMHNDKNCVEPEISFLPGEKGYQVTWFSQSGDERKVYSTNTSDFKSFTPATERTETKRESQKVTITIHGKPESGTLHRVDWKVIDGLLNAHKLSGYKNQLWAENMSGDAQRFNGLKQVEASIKVEVANTKTISNLLLGIFFEDINYAADGGIYAELVQNRGFEYSPSDKEGRDPNWNNLKAWTLNGEGAELTIDTVAPIHFNNRHFAVMNIQNPGAGLVNEGWDGIPLNAGEKYHVSLFARTLDGAKSGKITLRLIGKNGEIYAQTQTPIVKADWRKYEAVLTANVTVTDARLEVMPIMTGKIALDMISLFPQNTFKGRKNGLRNDLAQTIADVHPRFVRFPGGCVAHGDGLGNIYHWKNTIGPLEARKPQRNLWGYHQSAGLGYFEYFQFCEDIGAEPLPVVAAGVPCQNSACGPHGGGQQGGIPMCEMDTYVQDVLDLIEWANGDKNTTWGKKRAEAGHPAPFNLKYIGVGNEDLITDVFEERFAMIFNAVKEKYPEITVIGTVGPFHEGTDYVEGWKLAEKLSIPMVDEHYYASPGWFLHNQDYYDKYDRSKSKVYLGEYAAHLPGRPVNIETALAEALHLTTLERNGDVVAMASYAPLLAKEKFTQWNPDLIYFNNTEVKPTVGYHVQKLFGQNSGDEYIPGSITLTNPRSDVRMRIAYSVVRDSKTGDIIVKLVNLLPVEVKTNVDLTGLDVAEGQAQVHCLKGAPDDRKALPESSELSVSSQFPFTMPAYSFSVIRLIRNEPVELIPAKARR